MLDLVKLRSFVAAATSLSFRKAAETLHYAPSTVTMQIKALEEEFGAPLFDRAGRGMILTEHGRRLLPHALRLLDIEARIRGLSKGDTEVADELTLRISESLGIHLIPWLLPRFVELFPRTRLILRTASRAGTAQDLRQGATDLAVLLSEPFAAEGLTVEVPHRERLVVIVPADSPLAGCETVRAADLAGLPLILTPHVWSARPFIERAFQEADLAPAGWVECSSVEIVKRCVMQGLGVSVVPGFTVREEVSAGRLARLDWAEEPLWAPVLLMHRGEAWLSSPAKAFVQLARRFFDQPG